MAELPELVTDLAGFGMPYVIEDGQGLLPGRAGGGVVSVGMVDVAEVVEGFGYPGTRADFPVEVQGMLVERRSLGEVAETPFNIVYELRP